MYLECLYLMTNQGYIIIYVIASQTRPDDQSLTWRFPPRYVVLYWTIIFNNVFTQLFLFTSKIVIIIWYYLVVSL